MIVVAMAALYMTISVNTDAKDTDIIEDTYKLIFHTDPSVLENNVSWYLRKGYRPSGGVTIDDDGYYQVIYK